MASPREENVYMAKLADQAERYEEMVEFMKKVVGAVDGDELSVEGRNLLSVAYKYVIGARRASWRIISSIEQKEESCGNDSHVSCIKTYRSKMESELSSICDGILKLLDSKLIGSAATGDSKVFYLKMKGDYHRYLAEFKTGAERKEAAENTLYAYKTATSPVSKPTDLRSSRSSPPSATVFSSSITSIGCPSAAPTNISEGSYQHSGLRTINSFLASQSASFSLKHPLPSTKDITETIKLLLQRLGFTSKKIGEDLSHALKFLKCP